MDAAASPTTGAPPDAPVAGAERTHVTDNPAPKLPDEIDLGPAPPPPN
jgi:hypothetical protein